MIINDTSVSVLRKPLIQPFRIASGEHTELENLIFTVTLQDGTRGYGEAAIATHITGETFEGTRKNLVSLVPKLVGESICDQSRISAFLHEALPCNHSAVAAIEMAVLDAFTKKLSMPLWRFFGPKPCRLATDITLVIADVEETLLMARRFYARGFRIFKVKVGRDRDIDMKRMIAVSDSFPKAVFYLDGNQGYTAEQTITFVRALAKRKIQVLLVEQPVHKKDTEGLKKITRSIAAPVCADESVSTMRDAVRLIRSKAVKVINIKLMKHGIFEARNIAMLARAAGLELMIGSMMESALSATAAAHMAAGLGFFKFVDLDTPFFVRNGSDASRILSKNGVYNVGRIRSGIGVKP